MKVADFQAEVLNNSKIQVFAYMTGKSDKVHLMHSAVTRPRRIGGTGARPRKM